MSDLAISVKIKDADNNVVKEFTASIPAHYKEGHTCTANEANALSQTRKENVANFARGVQGQAALNKALADGADETALAKIVTDYDESYAFGAGGGFTRMSPEAAAILQLAQNVALKEFQRADGSLSKSKIIASDEYKARVEELRENPKIQAAAKSRLDQESEQY